MSPDSTVLKEQPCREVELGQSITWAIENFRHAATVVQARFSNYLLAASILFLAWAALFSVQSSSSGRSMVLFAIAALGVIISFLWMSLGSREGKFLALYMDTVCYLEDMMAEPGLMTERPINDLGEGKVVKLRFKKGSLHINQLERLVNSSRLLVWGPVVFGLAFLLCLAGSLMQS